MATSIKPPDSITLVTYTTLPIKNLAAIANTPNEEIEENGGNSLRIVDAWGLVPDS